VKHTFSELTGRLATRAGMAICLTIVHCGPGKQKALSDRSHFVRQFRPLFWTKPI